MSSVASPSLHSNTNDVSTTFDDEMHYEIKALKESVRMIVEKINELEGNETKDYASYNIFPVPPAIEVVWDKSNTTADILGSGREKDRFLHSIGSISRSCSSSKNRTSKKKKKKKCRPDDNMENEIKYLKESIELVISKIKTLEKTHRDNSRTRSVNSEARDNNNSYIKARTILGGKSDTLPKIITTNVETDIEENKTIPLDVEEKRKAPRRRSNNVGASRIISSDTKIQSTETSCGSSYTGSSTSWNCIFNIRKM